MHFKMLLLLILFGFTAQISFCQTKHALIVAIGNYPEPRKNRWPVISSLNDVPLIKNALLSSQQFDEKNIVVLADSQATKKGIVDALNKLIITVNKSDIVVIHFSSHGLQLEDDNNDEIDGFDEAIVPYGAAFSVDPEKFEQFSPGYLRDDLFGDLVTHLRNKLGKDGDLLVIIDACHSGTGTRGMETAKIRGGNIPMVSKNFHAKKNTGMDDPGVFKEDTGTKLSAGAASYVVISGAQAREINYECFDENDTPVGSLSYSFSKTISSLKGDITYRGLFALIENVMREKAPNQKPVLEGDGIDRELFGGKYQIQQPYFSINNDLSKRDAIVLNAGFVSGITKGSEMHFFETGTSNTAGKKPINSGKVIAVSAFSSTIKPDSINDNFINRHPWAFLSELSYGTEKLKLFVKDFKVVSKMLQDSLKDFPLIEFNQKCDLYIDTFRSINNWALKYPNSGIVFQDGFVFSGNYDLKNLKDALKRFDRLQYLKGLTFNEPGLSADIQLLFLDEKGKIDSNKLMTRTHAGRLELREDDLVYLRIINNGTKQFYINIVDIQPDGFINPVIPNKYLRDRNNNPAPVKWEDCLLKADDTMFLRNLPISIQKPYGDEIFKVFLSTSAIDLEDILTAANSSVVHNKRGILSGLEKIFIDSNVNESGKRGVEAKVNTDQNGAVFSFNFLIIAK